jgi:uncharacterized membrane protein required for colicin V production
MGSMSRLRLHIIFVGNIVDKIISKISVKIIRKSVGRAVGHIIKYLVWNVYMNFWSILVDFDPYDMSQHQFRFGKTVPSGNLLFILNMSSAVGCSPRLSFVEATVLSNMTVQLDHMSEYAASSRKNDQEKPDILNCFNVYAVGILPFKVI